MPQISIYRKAQFNAAHRLHVAEWSEQKNKDVFGLCNLPNYHGHNYTLIVKLTGEVDKQSGILFDLASLSSIIEEKIIERFDHKNLNLDTIEFAECNPTMENIAIAIYNILKPCLPPNLLLSIKLYETERNYTKYSG